MTGPGKVFRLIHLLNSPSTALALSRSKPRATRARSTGGARADETKETTMQDRIFIGVYPGGIVYADRKVERNGDYKRLAFLAYSTLELKIERDCPKKLRPIIEAFAAGVQARRGEAFAISASGQTVILGKS